MVLICVQVPATKDICIFCLARIHFSPVHTVRRPERHLLSSTRSLYRPPANALAQQKEDGFQDSDPASESQPPQPFSRGWTRAAAPSYLTPDEEALRDALQKKPTSGLSFRNIVSLHEGENGTTVRPKIRTHKVASSNGGENGTRLGLRISKHMTVSPNGRKNETTPGPKLVTHLTGSPNGSEDRTTPVPRQHTPPIFPRTRHTKNGENKRRVLSAVQLPSRMSQRNGRLPYHALAEAPQVTPILDRVEAESDAPVVENTSSTLPPASPSVPSLSIPHKPKFGSWAKSEKTMELSPDEEALREALRKEAAPKPQLPVHQISHSPHSSSLPEYRSRTSPQTSDARQEETVHTSPTQTSGTQEQKPYENKTSAEISDYRRARDAQLDDLISKSKEKPDFRRGDWYCNSCGENNFRRQPRCIRCQRARPSLPDWQCDECGHSNFPRHHLCRGCQAPNPSIHVGEPENTDNTKSWRLIRRGLRRVGVEFNDPHVRFVREQVPNQGRSEETQTKVAMEQNKMDKMERLERSLERTKNGEFVGLRGQFETATSRAMDDSYWSLDTDGSQVPDVESSKSVTPDKSTAEGGLVAWRAQSARNPGVNEAEGSQEKSAGREIVDQEFEDSSTKAKLTGRWKRWRNLPDAGHQALEQQTVEPQAVEPQTVEPQALEQQPVESENIEPQAIKPLDNGGSSTQTDNTTQLFFAELEREQMAKEVEIPTRKRARRVKGEPAEQGFAKQLIYDEAMPHARVSNRRQLRKSKRVYDDADEEDEDRAARRLERKEQRKKAGATKKAVAPPTPIYLPEFISVANLAGVLRVRVEDFIQKMKDLGFDETNNDHILDAETAGLVAAEFNFEPVSEQVENLDLLPRPPAQDKSILPPRPPVVTIMGHVDHGKTTLLDYLRKSSVAASEHGGITQHIGAFSVQMPGGRLITFLDTPGHEAFLKMRQRGANVTDIVILVVAADDSVKPQTVEAIKHAQTAKVPMIVAINKVDKEDSNTERVKQDLARYGVEIEDYGGDTQVVCVSGKTGQGMEELEDAAVALADVLDMRSEIDGQAEGWVLEATTKKAGRVATVLVRRGTLRPGDVIVAGTSWARVRSIRNEAGVMLASAGPGTPVEIDGWREQPGAGDEVLQAPDEQRARAVISHRLEVYERTQMATDMAAVNEARRLEQEKREESERAAEMAQDSPDGAATLRPEGHDSPSAPSFQEVFLIIKADVSGSVEAVTNAISPLGNSDVRPNILRTGVGPVTEFDIDHAADANGHIICFNTTVGGNIQRAAEAKKVNIMNQSIIYRLVDDVKMKLSEMLPEIITQKVLGEAEIAQVFEINIKGRVKVPVAGCRVRNGVIGKTNKVRVLRGKEVVYDGMLSHVSLHHHLVSANSTRLDSRHAFVPQKRQEGRHGDAKRKRVRDGLRKLDGVPKRRSGAML